MEIKKKKILFCTEFSYLNSGFGNYTHNILTRLFAKNKYDVAEHANYARLDDPKIHGVPWKCYANAPNNVDKRRDQYNANETNQFGYWRFDRILLDFKPDIVISWLDTQMCGHHIASPLRPYYNLTWMAPVDSAPQKLDWIDDFKNCDGIMTYAPYGQRILKEQGGNQINLVGIAGGGVDHNLFKPVINKKEHRRKLGLLPDSNIIGMVARNQVRKLFPDLFKAFRLFLDRANKELARKTFLYIHTSHPDIGWDIPENIQEFGLSNKVLCSYICKACKKHFIRFFADALTMCPYCKQIAGILPNVVQGYSDEQMVDVFNLIDLYVQYATNEGFGISVAEAAACGVPSAVVNYSAMEDFVDTLDSIPIKVQRFIKDIGTTAYKAYPENENLVKIIFDFFGKSESTRRTMGLKAREASKIYGWDKVADIWENYIDGVILKDRQGKWDLPPNYFSPNTNIPEIQSNKQFVEWCFTNILGKPEETHSAFGLECLRSLHYGAVRSGKVMKPFTRKEFVDKLLNIVHNQNTAEKYRCGLLKLKDEDYIKFASRQR